MRKFGFWDSPLTSAMVAQSHNKLAFPRAHQHRLYWQECLANEGNRWVVRAVDIRHPEEVVTLTPKDHEVSCKVHEYGGIAYGVSAYGLVWISKADQGVYLYEEGQHRLLFQDDAWVFGEPIPCKDGVILIAEKHEKRQGFPQNFLALIDFSGVLKILHQGEDFYAAPTISASGRDIAWLSWNIPDMPWQQTTLWQAELCRDGHLVEVARVYDKEGVAVFQPQFSSEGELFAVQDSSGLGRITRMKTGEVVASREAEHSLPLWQLGMRSYALLEGGGMACAHSIVGRWHLFATDGAEKMADIDIAGGHVSDPIAVSAGFAALVFPIDRPAELRYWSAACGQGDCLYAAGETLFPDHIVAPESLIFSGKAGQVQGYFYAPKTQSGEGRPPVIIKSHGGPSGQTDPGLNWKIQYWVTRGFAVFDVNYSGSTGFGRAYMQRLQGAWGDLDVQDCLAGLRYLIQQGLVDERLAFISGSSAGGLTTLGCLAASEAFAGGVSAYGVADLEGLVAITHKFEAHYLDGLVGELPRDREVYRARSPLYQAEKILAPMLFLQGGKDKVVPPVQMHKMVEAIRRKDNAPEVRVIEFPDEAHGFRAPRAIADALEAELQFYQHRLCEIAQL